jgi:uncharacterized protein (UPF0332 family)
MNDSEVDDLLEKGFQSLEAAESLFEDGFIDFSASRAYYAMFYSLEALLLDKNLSFSKHSGVISAFGKEFVKTGLLDQKFHQYVLEAFDLRNVGDYGAMHAVHKEKAVELMTNARELIGTIQKYILKSRKNNQEHTS